MCIEIIQKLHGNPKLLQCNTKMFSNLYDAMHTYREL